MCNILIYAEKKLWICILWRCDVLSFSLWYILDKQKNHLGLTQCALVPIGPSLIPTTVLNHQNFTTNPSLTKLFFALILHLYQYKKPHNNTPLEICLGRWWCLKPNLLFWSCNQYELTENISRDEPIGTYSTLVHILLPNYIKPLKCYH